MEYSCVHLITKHQVIICLGVLLCFSFITISKVWNPANNYALHENTNLSNLTSFFFEELSLIFEVAEEMEEVAGKKIKTALLVTLPCKFLSVKVAGAQKFSSRENDWQPCSSDMHKGSWWQCSTQ